MADIARLAGTSVSTVSRALSGSALIPESTRERIIEIARAFNYQVNISAANLRKRYVKTMGVTVLVESLQTISDPFILNILGAVADALDERGMNLLLSRLTSSRKDAMQAMVHGGQVAGMIVIGQNDLHDYLNEIAGQGLPIAVWGAALPDARYSVVGGDNEAGGYKATQHLIERGCRHIAFFGDTRHPEAKLRHQGYLKALQEAGLKAEPPLHQRITFGEEQIRGAINDWLDSSVRFDGIFAAADMTAFAIIGALRSRQIDVPTQVKIVGYDDVAMAAYSHPALSTVRQNTTAAGRELVRLVFDAIEGKAPQSVLLPTELIVRASSLVAGDVKRLG